MKELEIDTHIKPQQYQKLLVTLVTRKPVFILFMVLGIVAIGYLAAYLLGYFPTIGTFPFPVLIFVIALLFLPYLIYKKGKSDYYQNPRVSEHIRYMMDENGIAIAGESFTSAFTWDSITKVVESSEWIIIHHQGKVAGFIPKHDMSEEELDTFREVVRDVPELEVKLMG